MSIQHMTDGALATAAITSPFWIHLIKSGLAWYALIGGAVLVTLRVMLSVREWYKGR